MSQCARGSPSTEHGVLAEMLPVSRQGEGSNEIFVLKLIPQNLPEKQKLVEKPCYIVYSDKSSAINGLFNHIYLKNVSEDSGKPQEQTNRQQKWAAG